MRTRTVSSSATGHFTAGKDVGVGEVQKRFGTKLRALRADRGLSQEALADAAGLHRTYVSSVERGERNVTLVTIQRLADALGIRMSGLMPDS